MRGTIKEVHIEKNIILYNIFPKDSFDFRLFRYFSKPFTKMESIPLICNTETIKYFIDGEDPERLL